MHLAPDNAQWRNALLQLLTIVVSVSQPSVGLPDMPHRREVRTDRHWAIGTPTLLQQGGCLQEQIHEVHREESLLTRYAPGVIQAAQMWATLANVLLHEALVLHLVD